MLRLGRVIRVAPDRNAVVKAETLPRIGDVVVDEGSNPVGRVFDIVGPTISPYVVVQTGGKDPDRLLDSLVYVLPPVETRRARERKGR